MYRGCHKAERVFYAARAFSDWLCEQRGLASLANKLSLVRFVSQSTSNETNGLVIKDMLLRAIVVTFLESAISLTVYLRSPEIMVGRYKLDKEAAIGSVCPERLLHAAAAELFCLILVLTSTRHHAAAQHALVRAITEFWARPNRVAAEVITSNLHLFPDIPHFHRPLTSQNMLS